MAAELNADWLLEELDFDKVMKKNNKVLSPRNIARQTANADGKELWDVELPDLSISDNNDKGDVTGNLSYDATRPRLMN